jgi:hypothetical protein
MSIAAGLLAWTALVVQAAPPEAPPVEQRMVEDAIKKGVAYLKTAVSPANEPVLLDTDEILLWTFVQAGVPEDEARFQSLLKKMLASKLERTYKVALQAMILEELDRVSYQGRIAQCAQFLLDNECKNGQWSYGEPSPHVDALSTVAPRKETPTNADAPKPGTNGRVKPKVQAKIRVTRKRDGPDTGDNSNAQYAALGLRSCFDAGIQLPPDAITRARKWWEHSQYAAENASGEGKGWCYRWKGAKECRVSDRPYASMTVGGVGALAMYDYILGRDRKTDASIRKGLAWIEKNYSITENIGPCENSEGKPGAYLLYYLYALERMGILCETEKIGPHEWYPEGARMLLAAQNADGSWKVTQCPWVDPTTWDTSFAILFLRRATRPLEDVPSEDRYFKTKPAGDK